MEDYTLAPDVDWITFSKKDLSLSISPPPDSGGFKGKLSFTLLDNHARKPLSSEFTVDIKVIDPNASLTDSDEAYLDLIEELLIEKGDKEDIPAPRASFSPVTE